MDYAQGISDWSVGLAKAGLLLPAVNLARTQGVAVAGLLETVGLPENMGEDPSAVVPSRMWHGLFAELEILLGNADLGWQTAMAKPLAAYSYEFTKGISDAPSLFRAVEFIAQYGSRHCTTHNVHISLVGDYGYIYHHSGVDEAYAGGHHRALGRAASIIIAVREFLGADWVPDQLAFNFPIDTRPDDEIGDGARWIRCEGPSYVRVRRDQLSARCLNPIVSSYHQADAVAVCFEDAVRQVIGAYSFDGVPELNQIAEMLGTSRRTMQRRLGEAGTSYSKLVAESKYLVASRLLGESNRVTDVACALGYTDVSHFARFFKHHAGISPGRFKRLSQEGALAVGAEQHRYPAVIQ